LFAAEGGSRSWGWASENSDFDVRFIYIHHIEWYFSIEEGRKDVLDFKYPSSNTELHGWELRKALKMLRESNPGLIEWYS
jgi:predicted nucleotidyltransferase